MKMIFILLLSLQFLTAFSCNNSGSGKDEVKKTPSDGDNFNSYFPVKEGNSWSYVNEGPRDDTELFKVTVNDLKKVSDGIQLKLSSFPYLSKDNQERTLKVRQNGEIEIKDYIGYSGIIIPQQDDFRDGYQWKFGELTGRISSFSDTVATENGKFGGCLYVMLTDGFTFSYEMWFKKDMGIIKWGANRTNPPLLKPIYYVLKDHSLN